MTSSSLSLVRPRSIVVDAASTSPDRSAGATKPRTRKMPMPSLPMPTLNLGALRRSSFTALKAGGGSRRTRTRTGPLLVGLDIQPGYVAAVQARVDGTVVVERAAGAPLPPDTIREGEVLDQAALAETLAELFRDARLDRRVRIGIANQRTVLRTLELPAIGDGKEFAAAVRFQAADKIPMPLDSAVLDYHRVGAIETPNGPRERVVVVAAQRDMVDGVLGAVHRAGLRPEGIDLSAFALIRSLSRAEEDETGHVLYLNVGGLTTMAIAEGPICRFTRVAGGGLESMAVAIAERNEMPLIEARALLASIDLSQPPGEPALGPDVRPVLEAGVREIAGAVRNSLEFHRQQDGGGAVETVVVSGSALEIGGFADALRGELSVTVRAQTVGVLDADALESISAERLAIAAGLAVEEAPR